MKTPKVTLSEVDHDIMCLCPDGWFEAHDLPPDVKRCRYRCDRLLELGMLESRVVGKFPIFTTEFCLTDTARTWLLTDEAKRKTERLAVTFGSCKNWRIRYNIPKN